MADLSKTGKPSSRSREAAYRALVLAGRRLKPSALRVALAAPVRVAALREPAKKR